MLNLIDNICNIINTAGDREIILITKVSASGRRLLKHIAKKQALFGVSNYTPASLAKELCGSSMYDGSGNLRLLNDGQVEELIFSCIPDANDPSIGATDVLQHSSHFKDRATAKILKNIFTELKDNLVEASALEDLAKVPSLCDASKNRLQVVAELLRKYDAAKKAIPGQEKWDNGDLLHQAIISLKTNELFKEAVFILIEDQPFEKIELQLFDALKNRVGMDKFFELKPSIENISNLAAKTNITFAKGRSVEVEQRHILRDIVAKNRPVEECLIVYLGSDYPSSLLNEAQTFGLQVNMSGGVSFTQNKYYHLFKALIAWQQSNFDGEELYKLVSNQVLFMKNSSTFCKLLHEYKAGWGLARYKDIFTLAEQELQAANALIAANPSYKLDRKQKLLRKAEPYLKDWQATIEKLIVAAQQQGTMEEQKAALLALLSGVNKQDAIAFGLIRKSIKSLESLYGDETVLIRLLKGLEGVRYLGSSDKPGRLTCSALKKGLFTGKKYLYLCGLDRFALQNSHEAPLLLDMEKSSLGLKTLSDHQADTERLIKLLLTEPFEEITLSYNYYDTDKMIELQPATLFRKLAEGKNIEIVDYVNSTNPILLGDYISTGASPNLVLKAPAPAAADSKAYPLSPTVKYEDRIRNMTYSPSRLESALNCPFKFYMQKIMNLFPYEVPVSNEEQWLDAREQGTLCHTVLEEYYKANPIPVALKDYDTVAAPAVAKLLTDEIEKLKLSRPLASPAAMDNSRRQVEAFLEHEIKWTSEAANGIKKVLETEFKFGAKYGNSDVEITILKATNPGEADFKIKLNGSIDRIDRREENGKDIYCVIDYKTGKPFKDEQKSPKLQPFLYSLVAETLGKVTQVDKAGYLFVKTASNKMEVLAEQTPDYRTSRGNTIKDFILKILSNEDQVIKDKCLKLSFDNEGHIISKGDFNERKAAMRGINYCNNCPFIDFCYEELQLLGKR